MISIIDYGMGNLRSVAKAIERCGGRARIVRSADEVQAAEKIILPGVGAFADAMANLRAAGLVDVLRRVTDEGRPLLGICLGCQLLFSRGWEDGEHEGLDIIAGEVPAFDFSGLDTAGRKLAIPHMGWNAVRFNPDCPLTAGLEQGDYVYFVHGYYVRPADPAVAAFTCEYGIEFAAGVWVKEKNLFATQFHPEKSQQVGLKMIENFVKYRA